VHYKEPDCDDDSVSGTTASQPSIEDLMLYRAVPGVATHTTQESASF